MGERRYRDTDIEAILGRASLIQHEQTAPSGLSLEGARATVLEIGRSIGISTGALETAFRDDHFAHLDDQRWLSQIEYVPTLRAVAEPILARGTAWAKEQKWATRQTYLPIRVERPGLADERGADRPTGRSEPTDGLQAALYHVVRKGEYILGIPIVNPVTVPLITLELHTYRGTWYLRGRIRAHALVDVLDAALLQAREQVGGRLQVDTIELGS